MDSYTQYNADFVPIPSRRLNQVARAVSEVMRRNAARVSTESACLRSAPTTSTLRKRMRGPSQLGHPRLHAVHLAAGLRETSLTRLPRRTRATGNDGTPATTPP